jgi:hypothetical protein
MENLQPIKVVLATAGVPTAAGHIYTQKALENVVKGQKKFYHGEDKTGGYNLQDKAKTPVQAILSMGEKEEKLAQLLSINIGNVTHRVSNLEMDGNKLVGKIEYCGAKGDDVIRAMLDNEQRPVFGIRALCDKQPNGVLNNISVISFDLVNFEDKHA